MLNIKKEYLEELRKIFNTYCPKAEIWAYGSRVKNDFHSGSDLDLTIKTFNEDNKNVSELKTIINNSNIPFLVDINEFEQLPKYFKDEIEKAHIRIF